MTTEVIKTKSAAQTRKPRRRAVTGSLFWHTLDIPQPECVELLRRMYRMRHFESVCQKLAALKSETPGDERAAHPELQRLQLALGHEAVAAGACSVLRADDFLAATHRTQAYALAREADLKTLFCELLGKAEGCCSGRGGVSQLLWAQKGQVALPELAGALGAALACKFNGKKQLVLACFAVEEARSTDFDALLALAASEQLPIVLLCENIKGSRAGHVYTRTQSAGVEGISCDGMNVLEVRETVSNACARARGGKPALIEALLHRHPGAERDDAKYQDELAAWKGRDPLRLFRSRLNELNLLTAPQAAKLEQQTQREVESAARLALKESKLPAASQVTAHVYTQWTLSSLGLVRAGTPLS